MFWYLSAYLPHLLGKFGAVCYWLDDSLVGQHCAIKLHAYGHNDIFGKRMDWVDQNNNESVVILEGWNNEYERVVWADAHAVHIEVTNQADIVVIVDKIEFKHKKPPHMFYLKIWK